MSQTAVPTSPFALLRRPVVARLLASSLLGRLPTGMVPVALVLFSRGESAGYGVAGLLAAAYTAGSAIGGPVLARWMDRTGQTRVIVGAGVACSVALALLPFVGTVGGIVVAVVAGVATPPVEPGLRAIWPTVLPAPDVPRVYALDAASQELVFVTGPLLVLVAGSFGSAGGLYAAAAIGLVGTLWFAAAPQSRGWRPEEVEERHWAGALRPPRLRRVYLGMLLVGLTVGTFPVAAAAFGEASGDRGWATWLVAANASGALIGGVWFSGRSERVSPGRVLPWLLCGLGVGYLPLAFVPTTSGVFPLALVLSVVSGLFLPLIITLVFLVIDRLAPTGTVTEAFAWLITAFLVGSSIGAAIAGALIAAVSVAAVFAVASAASLLGAVPMIRLLPRESA
ncbi:MFS transporter [Cryptosporangium aurantiacum]|uniref:Predicted arabinose efflux permease, MFS family n=1 Tax=Cryptosporangium aurantiacum TaxID=134849 RepID=A0A1M7QWN3_9ACTN|nr:MFS transporter [Cryptosporangium aurantiacum]SHN36017.1 Predicted arabinose efflux permease, MFS family [Cryptosporangium aurantiacum]